MVKSRDFFHMPSTWRKTNIFALFFSQPSQVPGLSAGVDYAKLRVHAHNRQTDRRTYGDAISIAERLLRNAPFAINTVNALPRNVKDIGKVIPRRHLESDQHQNLTTDIGPQS